MAVCQACGNEKPDVEQRENPFPSGKKPLIQVCATCHSRLVRNAIHHAG
jgi:hypothetical protein